MLSFLSKVTWCCFNVKGETLEEFSRAYSKWSHRFMTKNAIANKSVHQDSS